MHRFVHHNTTDSINSLLEMLTFRTEELVIPLTEIEFLVPDFVNRGLPASCLGVGVYVGDEINPRWIFSNRDELFLKTPQGLKSVVSAELESYKGVYLRSPLLRSYGIQQQMIGLEYFFTPYARPKRSEIAQRKMVAIQTISLYMQTEPIHAFCAELDIPSLKALYPPADVEAWRNHALKNGMGINRPLSNQSFLGQYPSEYWTELEEKMPDENDFNFKLLAALGTNMKGVFKEINKFLDSHRDCMYTMELQGDKLAIVRGIDHKYIPYYEQKFRNDDQT